jgi:hypothetical protein
MPIKKIKAQSPDPYVGKIAGDTEFARLAHLNNIVDQINAGGGGGGGSVATQGTSLYSTDPSTAGFSTNNGIFLVLDTGLNASGATFSNFIGYYSGRNATNAYNSNFLGPTAGINATNAYQSNFSGSNAGDAATNAHRSNFLGFYAGQNATNANNSNFLGSPISVAISTSVLNFSGTADNLSRAS